MYPYSSTLFSLSVVENEQADAGQDGRARLARRNFYARTGTGKSCFSIQLTTTRIGSYTRLIHTLQKVLTIYTYICDKVTITPQGKSQLTITTR